MSIVTIEFDNTLEKSEIIMPLMSSSKQEGGDEYNDVNMTDKAQTAVFGIQVPLIMINNTIIDFDAVHYFSLKSDGRLPELMMTVEDRYEIINNIDKPSLDNEVRVQILPKFDDTYKKIDLTFYITSISVTGSIVRLTCAYKLSDLLSSRFKAFGEVDTYTLFKDTATATKLGFATNLGGSNDIRFTYCDNKSYLDLLNDEIEFSNATEHIMDWWVDLWNNINLVDIKERYTTIDSDDDLLVWASGQVHEVTSDVEIKPIQIPAVIHNHPSMGNSELFVKNYNIISNPGVNISSGSDKVYGIYEDANDEYLDYLIQDGDVKNDIFTKYDYVGENYGEYNYLLARQLRSGFLQKVNSETIKATLQSPMIGLMRGHKVNFIRYINDDTVEMKMQNLEDAGVINRDVQTNIPLKDYEVTEDSTNGMFKIDKTVSGQYLIIGVDIIFNNNSWDYILTLSRPANETPTIKTV